MDRTEGPFLSDDTRILATVLALGIPFAVSVIVLAAYITNRLNPSTFTKEKFKADLRSLVGLRPKPHILNDDDGTSNSTYTPDNRLPATLRSNQRGKRESGRSIRSKLARNEDIESVISDTVAWRFARDTGERNGNNGNNGVVEMETLQVPKTAVTNKKVKWCGCRYGCRHDHDHTAIVERGRERSGRHTATHTHARVRSSSAAVPRELLQKQRGQRRSASVGSPVVINVSVVAPPVYGNDGFGWGGDGEGSGEEGLPRYESNGQGYTAAGY